MRAARGEGRHLVPHCRLDSALSTYTYASFSPASRSIGMQLTSSLDTLIQSGHINPVLAIRVLQQFDKSIAEVLHAKIKAKATVKGHLKDYNSCDEVWTFNVKGNMKMDGGEEISVDKLKIVGVDRASGRGQTCRAVRSNAHRHSPSSYRWHASSQSQSDINETLSSMCAITHRLRHLPPYHQPVGRCTPPAARRLRRLLDLTALTPPQLYF